MPVYDASSADCFVFTFKEGLLSAVAHDLKLRASKFRIEVDEAAGSVRASFEADSLRVVCAMKGGVQGGSLSDKDRRDIEDNIAKDVLEPRKHARIVFESESVTRQGDGFRITGKLAIKGKERSIALSARRRGDRLVAEVPVHQPDFGIKPFSAALGTMKIKPEISVLVSIPSPPP
jgi:hypothetical protein